MSRKNSGKNGLFIIILAVFATTTAGLFGSFLFLKTPSADAVACFAVDGGLNDDDSTVNGEVLINSAKNVAADATAYDCTATNFRIGGSGVLTLQGNTGTGAIAQINFSGLTIDSGGVISANGQGCAGDTGHGNNPNGSNVCVNDGGLGTPAQQYSGGGGAGHGGAGGLGRPPNGIGGTTYGSSTAPLLFGGSGAGGSGGGTGGAGGGVVRITVSGTLTHNGTISANGGAGISGGTDNGGGGAGGSVYVTAAVLNSTNGGSNYFSASGGAGASGGFGGGGGGAGRIVVEYQSGTFAFDSGDFALSGGAGGTGTTTSGTAGTKGTAYVLDTQGTGPTTDDDVTVYHGFTFTDTDFSVATWTSDSGATNQYCDTTLSSGATPSVTAAASIAFGGTMTCTPTHASFAWTSASFAVGAGASMTVNSALTLDGNSSFSIGNNAVITNTKTNADLVFDIPAGNDQTWTGVTVNGAPEGDFSIDDAIAITLAGSTAVNANAQWTNLTNLTVGSSASIAASAKGCVGDSANGNNPNVSNACINNGGLGTPAVQYSAGGGAGHGGTGGLGRPPNGTGGTTYGSATAPVLFGGSGAGGIGGGTGGTGGGAVRLNVSGTFTNDGIVTANGGAGTSGGSDNGGGGAGGSVYVTTSVMNGTTGTFGAGGGAGASGTFGGGGGGGGRVVITYQSGSYSFDSGDFAMTGGAGGTGSSTSGAAGTKGTVYVRNTTTSRVDIFHGFTYADTDFSETTWVVDSSATNQYCDLTLGGSATPSVTAPTLSFAGSLACTPSITSFAMSTSGTMSVAASSVISTNSALSLAGTAGFTIGSGTSISITKTAAALSFDIPAGSSQTWTNVTVTVPGQFVIDDAVTITLSGTTAINANVQWTNLTNLTVSSGTSINANAKGCVGDSGHGNGPNGSNVCQNDSGVAAQAQQYSAGGGGGHGGAGGLGRPPNGTGGATYDSSAAPVLYGASGAGGIGGGIGGTGGGTIRLVVSGTFTNNGSVTANAGNGTSGGSDNGGGGAGGSIYVTTGTYTCSVAPTLTATGGSGASGTFGGGGGGGGRVSIEYATDSCGSAPLSGLTAASVAGGGAGGSGSSTSGVAGSTGSLSITATNPAPAVTVVTHTPAAPTQVTPVTLSGTATDNVGVTRIDIFLDGTAPANLKHTCLFSPSQTPATCAVSVGTIAYGAHTTTIRAYDGASTTDGIENFNVSGSTLASGPQISRSKASATGVSFTLSFTLQGTSTGTLTVTFPVGFTVTQAPSGAGSSGCLSSFGSTSSTMTATKTACTGTVVLAGGQVTNPATPGVYVISWTNDSGSGSVVITDDDQVTVSGQVDPQLTFNAGSQTAACDGTFSGFGGGLGLGTLTTAVVASSDVVSVPHVCTRVTANAGGGAVVSVRSANAALASVSTPSHVISSATATLVAGTAGYGMCVGSSGGDTGRDTTTPAGATPSAAAPFSSSCTTSAHSVGALTTSAQTLWSISGPSQNAFARIFVKAAISPTTNAHADYADTLTFIATGTY